MVELLLGLIAVLLILGLLQRKNHMASLNASIDELAAVIESGLNDITSAITDLQGADTSEAQARIENLKTALEAGFASLRAADPTPVEVPPGE